MSRNSLVRRAVLGLLFIALVTLGVLAGTRAGSGRLVSVSNPSSELSQDRPATVKIAGERDAVRNARTTPGEGPIRRLRGVQIRGANLSGRCDPAVDGAERQEHF